MKKLLIISLVVVILLAVAFFAFKKFFPGEGSASDAFTQNPNLPPPVKPSEYEGKSDAQIKQDYAQRYKNKFIRIEGTQTPIYYLNGSGSLQKIQDSFYTYFIDTLPIGQGQAPQAVILSKLNNKTESVNSYLFKIMPPGPLLSNQEVIELLKSM